MGVDQVDLIQLHNLVEPDEWDVAFGPGGAVEALAAGARRGARALHRRDRSRAAHRRDAPAQPRAVRLRLGAVARTTSRCCQRARLPRRRRGACSSCAPNATSPCRRSRRSPGVAGRRTPEQRFSWYEPLDRSRRDRPRRALRARRRAGVPQHHQRRPPAAAHRRRRRRRRSTARPTTRCSPTTRRSASHRCSTAPSSSESDRAVARQPTGNSIGTVSPEYVMRSQRSSAPALSNPRITPSPSTHTESSVSSTAAGEGSTVATHSFHWNG